MTDSEKNFYEALGRTPDLPDSVYAGIMRSITRMRTLRRAIWSAAAVLIAGIGVWYLGSVRQPATQNDIADELQAIGIYANGEDVADDFNAYALVDYEHY